jgi:hypothetical protein
MADARLPDDFYDLVSHHLHPEHVVLAEMMAPLFLEISSDIRPPRPHRPKVRIGPGDSTRACAKTCAGSWSSATRAR